MSLNFQAEESNPLGYGCFGFFFFLVYGTVILKCSLIAQMMVKYPLRWKIFVLMFLLSLLYLNI